MSMSRNTGFKWCQQRVFFKTGKRSQASWYKPIIPATQEVEIG
jgi:hypothetical protein